MLNRQNFISLPALHALLQVSDGAGDYNAHSGLQQPTLNSLGSLLNYVTTVLERAAEEKSLLLNKVKYDCRAAEENCFVFTSYGNIMKC